MDIKQGESMGPIDREKLLKAFLRLDWTTVRRSILLARLQAEFNLVEIPAED
jgi:hypothetical protein